MSAYWTEWQHRVVIVIRREFREELHDIGEDDVDWDAWRPLYDEGLSPEGAVKCAFSLGKLAVEN